PHWKRVLAGVLATVLVGVFETLFAAGCGILVDGLTTINANLQNGRGIFANIMIGDERIYNVPVTISGFDEAIKFIIVFGCFVLSLVLMKSLFVYAKEYLMSSVTQKVLRTLRHNIYSHVVYLPMRFFDKVKTGTTMNRIIYDVSNIEHCFSSGMTILQSIIFSFMFLGYMFFIEWELTLFACFMFPVSAYVLKYFSNQFRKVNRKITEQLAKINAYILESLSSIKIVKSYAREDYERKRFLDKVNQHYYYNMRSVRLTAFLKPINETVSLSGMIFVIGFAGYRMITGQMNMGDLTVFLVLLTMVYKPIKGLGDTPNVIQRALASADKIFSMLDEKPENITETGGSRDIANIEGGVVFDNVSFSYNGEDFVLDGISFKVKKGETIALVGPSGAGKSTIINLLMKFYHPQKGAIFIDDVNIRDITLKSLRSQIGFVPQETMLFSGTVIE
ncbi:ABC transporter ATP-binding protein, partial [bacterium]|nr:ABC transporter ATP-binding protein [bacterium]